MKLTYWGRVGLIIVISPVSHFLTTLPDRVRWAVTEGNLWKRFSIDLITIVHINCQFTSYNYHLKNQGLLHSGHISKYLMFCSFLDN